MTDRHTNRLINETSPYLLQHAHNPVDWHAWNDETIEKAKRENKPLLVSIGYSSCHWCHVMEAESFEDEATAAIMNENYIPVKVDREERPDLDHIYMTAVQLITRSGGWPLNVIALPDGTPVWGGTYFPKEKWKSVLIEIAGMFREKPDEIGDYAKNLARGIVDSSLVPDTYFEAADIGLLKEGLEKWKGAFDPVYGGQTGAPKFPMPVNISFLQHWGYEMKDEAILKHVELTLEKIAMGGIFDQAGGGFARYSVDKKWKVPHFEKMLYDNAQLISIYSNGYRQFRNPLFKEVVYKTFQFLTREMNDSSGFFYSALDADSEGEEGRFYTWTIKELDDLKLPDYELFRSYYSIDPSHIWDNDRYILHRNIDDAGFCKEHGLSASDLAEKKEIWSSSLLKLREKRVRPSLDDKCLAGWNGLMLSSLVEAYRSFGDNMFLQEAVKLAGRISATIKHNKGLVRRNLKKADERTPVFLDDFALVAQGLIALSEVDDNRQWLSEAVSLTDKTTELFYDSKNSMFCFNPVDSKVLVTNYFETYDNVIPSSNAIMAGNLFRLARLASNSTYLSISEKMTRKMWGHAAANPNGFAEWCKVILYQSLPFSEIIITGGEAEKRLKEIASLYIPGSVTAISKKEDSTLLFKGRHKEGKTQIWVCENNQCKLPVEDVSVAIKTLNAIRH